MTDNACIGCGYCCAKATCAIGARLHGPQPRCPELLFVGGRHWCRWVISCELKEDEAEGIMAKKAIGVDDGCCSPLNSWRREEIVDRTKGEPNKQMGPQSFLAAFFSQIGSLAIQPNPKWKGEP